MKKVIKYLTLGLGGFLVTILITVYGYSAVQTIAGLAVAQTPTLWNNVKDLAAGDNLTNGILAAGVVAFDGTNFDRIRGDTTNGLDVDVTRVSGTVTVAGAITPADNFVNPTTAVTTWSLLGCFDGTTWDRCLNTTHGDNITTASGLNVASVNYGFDVAGANYDRIVTYTFGDGVTTTNNPRGLSVANVPMEFNNTTYDRVRNQFTQSTASITGNAAGTTLAMTTTPMSNMTMQIDRTAGSTDAVEVDLECSLDATDFTQIATITSLVGEPVLTTATGTACPNMRYNVVTVGSGNTLQIHLLATR
jgi:hypothetical protein